VVTTYNAALSSAVNSFIESTDNEINVLDGNGPSGGQLSITIDSEELLVTAVRKTGANGPWFFTVLRGQNGTDASTHDVSSLVSLILTTNITETTVVLPEQTGNQGYFLGTDGTNVFWGAPQGTTIPFQLNNDGRVLTTNGSDYFWGDIPLQYPDPSASSGQYLTNDGTNLLWAPAPDGLPTQTSNSGKILTTNGTVASWEDAPSGTPSRQPFAFVYSSGSVIAADGSYHQAILDSQVSDPFHMSNNSGVVIPSAGDYLTIITLPVTTPGTGSITARIYKNGTPAIDYFRLTTNGNDFMGSGSNISAFAANDVLTLYILQSTGGSISCTPQLSIKKLF